MRTEQATPEQIGLYLPTTRAVAAGSVQVRYKRSVDSTWKAAHPLLRISTTGNEADGPTTLVDAFAGSIFDLAPGVTYDVELTHTENGQPTKASTIQRTTRALPAASGAANRSANSVATIGTQLAAVNPGDVLEIAAGTYDVSSLTLSRSGTAGSPIYIRGASRTGTVLRRTSSAVLNISASHVVLENLTIQGSGVDGGSTPTPVSRGIDISGARTNVTIRNVDITGVDGGIGGDSALTGALVYNCQLAGNNPWSAAAGNSTWNDDGINVPGFGNAVWNNTLSGFGDSLACNKSPNIGVLRAEGIYFYRNRINNNGDDLIEFDYGTRNIACYDNLITNTATAASFSYHYGGPVYFFRNIVVNTVRGPIKGNAEGTGITGMLIYNNTFVRTTGTNSWAFIQNDNGAWGNFSYRNNLFVYRGTGTQVMAIDPPITAPADFTNNAWFPSGSFWWPGSGGNFGSLAAAQSGLPSRTPLFGSAQRHSGDVITVTNPFTNAITLGSSYTTEYNGTPDAALSASGPRNLGVAIPGITDGFSGAAPDIGAVIEGRAGVSYGASR